MFESLNFVFFLRFYFFFIHAKSLFLFSFNIIALSRERKEAALLVRPIEFGYFMNMIFQFQFSKKSIFSRKIKLVFYIFAGT